MKKILLATIFLFFAFHASFIQAQSTPDFFQPQVGTTYLRSTSEGFSETIRFTLPDTIWSLGMGIPIDSMSIDSITGLPQASVWEAGCGDITRCVSLPLISKDINIKSFLGNTFAGIYVITIQCTVFSNFLGGALPPVSFKYQIEVYPNTQKHDLITTYLIDSSSYSGIVCNGSAKITATKGTAPYTYKWSSGETTDSISGKCSNNYTVIVSDNSNIKDTLVIAIVDSTGNANPNPNPNPIPGTICDTCTNYITYFATQNELFVEHFPLHFDSLSPIIVDSMVFTTVTGLPNGISWQTKCGINKKCTYTSAGNITFTGIPTDIGKYVITLKGIQYAHGLGVTSVDPIERTDVIYVFPQNDSHDLITSFESQNISSFGLCDGSANVIVTKGTAPYTYKWSAGGTGKKISSKCSGKYTLKVSDAMGLKDSIDIYISEPTQTFQPPFIVYGPVDTLITNYDTCIVDYNQPIDSAFARTFTMLDSTHLSVDFEIYQAGNRITFNALFSFDTVGFNQLNLVLNCKGTFLRMLKSTVITQVVNLQYSQIGTTQVIDHNDLVLDIEALNTNQNVLIYPNPFSSQTTITITKEVKNASVKVIDVLGNVVKTIKFSGTQVVLDKGELSSGIYFIQVLSNDVVFTTQKVVVQ